MTHTSALMGQIQAGAFDQSFRLLYPRETAAESRARYLGALRAFEGLYGPREAVLVSAPGRTEVGGNHTDHQQGCVVAAAVDLDVVCVAAPTGGEQISIQSEGYPRDVVALEDLSPQGSRDSAALIRGVAEWFTLRGHRVGGFDAYTISRVLGGSGLSSSAAFEVAVGQMLSTLFNEGALPPVELARGGQYAENRHFGKPSGLMDQTASAVGGFVGIDFADPAAPSITPVTCDLAAGNLRLCIVDCGGSHANLTPDYAAIPREMGQVAAFFGKEVLRQVEEGVFWARLPALRAAVGDRPLLRAIHFFGENRRAAALAACLEQGDFSGFLARVRQSGDSSWQLLQNVVAHPARQELAVALALSAQLLGEEGACRVHGGGFAGTIQAFVPQALLEDYLAGMTALLGPEACHLLAVRPVGAVEVTPTLYLDSLEVR